MVNYCSLMGHPVLRLYERNSGNKQKKINPLPDFDYCHIMLSFHRPNNVFSSFREYVQSQIRYYLLQKQVHWKLTSCNLQNNLKLCSDQNYTRYPLLLRKIFIILHNSSHTFHIPFVRRTSSRVFSSIQALRFSKYVNYKALFLCFTG